VRRIVRVLAWLLIAAGGAAVGTLALPTTGLRGAYFSNLTRSGTPNKVIVDRSPSTQALDNERVWLPPEDREVAREMRLRAAEEGLRAPVQVMEGNYKLMAGTCAWWDGVSGKG